MGPCLLAEIDPCLALLFDYGGVFFVLSFRLLRSSWPTAGY